MQNYFCPQVKLLRKTRIGSKYKREHTKPITPYDRLMVSKHITEEDKTKMKATYDTLNPFVLRENVQKKLKVVYELISKPIDSGVSA